MDLKTVNGSLGSFKKEKSLLLLYTGGNNRSTTYQCDALISKYLIRIPC